MRLKKHSCNLKKPEIVDRMRETSKEAVETFTACGGEFYRCIAYGNVNAAWQCSAISDKERQDFLITLQWAMHAEKGSK